MLVLAFRENCYVRESHEVVSESFSCFALPSGFDRCTSQQSSVRFGRGLKHSAGTLALRLRKAKILLRVYRALDAAMAQFQKAIDFITGVWRQCLLVIFLDETSC